MKFHKLTNLGFFFWGSIILLGIWFVNYLAIGISICAYMQYVLFAALLDEADNLIESLRDHELEQNKNIILGEWDESRN